MKWFGIIAFSNQTVDPDTGITDDTPIERQYFGDLVRNNKANQLTSINPDISISNQLSVLADPFLLNSFQDILYVTFMDQKWRVSSVDVNYPRLTLSFGSLYKEEEDNG